MYIYFDLHKGPKHLGIFFGQLYVLFTDGALYIYIHTFSYMYIYINILLCLRLFISVKQNEPQALFELGSN